MTQPSQSINIYCQDRNSGDGRYEKGWTDKGAKGANWQPGTWGSAGQEDQGQQGTRPVAPTVSQPAGSGVITALRSHLQSSTDDEPNKYVTIGELKEVSISLISLLELEPGLERLKFELGEPEHKLTDRLKTLLRRSTN